MKCFLVGAGGVGTLAEGNYALSDSVETCDTTQIDQNMLKCPSGSIPQKNI